eukprot:TRINITY_DN4754_c0_g1_i1.p1 TRINITY_DN4754_c0_g1~~TRINITY_DN4754_c0_g1_i1.p1  ORF type:complete len:833 (+),score=105.77 TRINITY_DN4754_c0_g1_i1:49-2499(+)
MTWLRLTSAVLVGLFVLLAISTVNSQSAPSCSSMNVNVAEQTLDGPIQQIVWVNSTDTVVEAIFVLTQARTVYRSANHGKTFTAQSAALHDITKIVQSANPKILYFIGTNALWTTEDQGEHYANIHTSLRILNIAAHPTQPTWALGYAETAKCTDSSRSGYCHYDLYLTQNTGITWTLVATYVYRDQFGWGDAGKDNVAEKNVYWISYNAKDIDQRVLDPYNLQFQRTRDLFHTIDYKREHSLAFKFYQRALLLAQLIPNGGDVDLALYASLDAGDTFVHCDFPSAFKEYGYTIVDLTEGAAFVNVAHDAQGLYGTTYESDSKMEKFSVSLQHVKRQARSGRADFKRIKGLEGIYMANQLDVNDDDPTNDDARGYSLVSFDKGGRWEKLSPPATDLNNQPPCDGCSLNLLGFDASHRGTKAFYSRNNAPGVIVASGVVGKWLLDRPDEVNTFMSYDAGMSWTEAAKGEHIYEINNFGGLILMAKTFEAAKDIRFSWNQGASFTACKAANTPFEVVDIVSAPSATDLVFLVYGFRGTQTVIFQVDFSNYGARQCSDTDYENWSPSDVRGDQCLMGQRITYLRRKAGTECFNPVTHQYPLPNAVPCVCKREDFMCDYCFEPSPLDQNVCLRSPVCGDKQAFAPPADCKTTYMKTKGYRLIPGNKCLAKDSGEYAKLMPEEAPCPGTPTGKGGGGGGGGLTGAAVFGIVLLTLFAVCAICVAGTFLLYRFVPAVHDAVEPHLPTAATAESLFAMLPKRRTPDSSGQDYTVLTVGSEPQSLLDDDAGGDDSVFGDAQPTSTKAKGKNKSTSFLDDDENMF